jgi:ArsR family transcriptional regulator, arsenate/arsenite/antimonite-responsive transcriptional repressor
MTPGGALTFETRSDYPQSGTTETALPNGGIMDRRNAAIVLAALAHALRLELWCTLLPYGQGGLSAGSIAGMLNIAPSSLSFHLQQMTHAHVLLQRRSQRRIIYAVNTEAMDALRAFLARPAI